ncbi:MAG TPA: hypothetical protein VEY31_15460 [Roseococcus sp.]|nr:hypothetical protein [Roseococcus sp.]
MSDRVEGSRGGDIALMGLRLALLACGAGLVGVILHTVWRVVAA